MNHIKNILETILAVELLEFHDRNLLSHEMAQPAKASKRKQELLIEAIARLESDEELFDEESYSDGYKVGIRSALAKCDVPVAKSSPTTTEGVAAKSTALRIKEEIAGLLQ